MIRPIKLDAPSKVYSIYLMPAFMHPHFDKWAEQLWISCCWPYEIWPKLSQICVCVCSSKNLSKSGWCMCFSLIYGLFPEKMATTIYLRMLVYLLLLVVCKKNHGSQVKNKICISTMDTRAYCFPHSTVRNIFVFLNTTFLN